MRRLRPSVVALLLSAVMVPGLVLAVGFPVHVTGSQQGGGTLVINGVIFAPIVNRSVVSWEEQSGPAFANAKVTVSGGGVYEFNLVTVLGPPTNDFIQGRWDVAYNGAPLCTACPGIAKGLSNPVGGMYSFDVAGGAFRLDAITTLRYNY